MMTSTVGKVVPLSVGLSLLLLYLFCTNSVKSFDLDGEFGVSDFLQRLSKREKEENEFMETYGDFDSVHFRDDCEENVGGLKEKRSADSTVHKRKKRATIAWPQRSKFTAELYYVIPLISPPQITIPVAFGVPFSFDIPNATASMKFRERSIHDRYHIYGVVEGIFQSFGIDGRSCILRAICERAEHHLLTNGIMSELVNLILSVTTSSNEGLMYDYVEAEKQGRKEGNCKVKYTKCPFSIFKIFGTF